MTLGEWLEQTTKAFSDAGISSARLDAQILAADALGRDKSWLLAHLDFEIVEDVLAKLKPQVAERAARTPLAYIRGKAEFYGREFVVNQRVLIPRPETETIIDMIKKYIHDGQLLDVGTGSGAIALTAALELPHLMVEACDISQEALNVAIDNEDNLGSHVHFFISNLLNEVDENECQYHAIVGNLPYVGRSWEVSPETAAEPETALYANDDGLDLTYKLIADAPRCLMPGGYLMLEADPRQHEAIKKAAAEQGFTPVAAEGFCLVFRL